MPYYHLSSFLRHITAELINPNLVFVEYYFSILIMNAATYFLYKINSKTVRFKPFFLILAPAAASPAVAAPAATPPTPIPISAPTPTPAPTPVLPQNPIQLPTAPTTLLSPTKIGGGQTGPTIIRMAAPPGGATGGQILRTIGGQNVVRVRAPAPTLAAGQQIKVVGSSGQIIKSTTVSAGQAVQGKFLCLDQD